ncbi:MAG: GH3 auxin-responsive promoter family protein [Candidatus Bathyarchaeota archaeon]|nr:GH3 auxin-responsive promoter family protein [Candidatus Bathyarchaeota archaeon]
MYLSAKTGADFLQQIVNPWYEALQNPAEAQQQVLESLVKGYAKTLYGKKHAALDVKGAADFRANFPKINYKELCPYFDEVKRDNHAVILSEPPLCWVMTRGSTGRAKVFPVTKTHIEQIFICGARALVNHALRKDDFELLTGKILNLNFPSTVTTIDEDGHKITYGYSSGIYAKLNPMLDQVSLLPRQEEIDALGPGITKPDWERRFELVYERALNERVVAAMGVTPVILSFGRYVKRRHGKKPKDMWSFRALVCTSVRKIQFKYGPVLRKYFGEVPIVEMYSATEGVFAQQLDDLPYVTPNYDKYYFEVETSKGSKMLHELKRGEWGRLIISSCLFPRYDIGDMIEAMGKNYFRVFGRAKTLTVLEHRLYRLLFRWFL